MTLTIAAYGMILLIVYLLIREKCSLAPVFILVPVAAALCCGFSMTEIAGFVAQGIWYEDEEYKLTKGTLRCRYVQQEMGG